MIGLNTFAEHFKEYNNTYIVIGGAACDDLFEQQGLAFRATRDVDLILVVEVLNDAFIERFWDFIRLGKYERNEVAHQRQYYRFIKPEADTFPPQVELFCRTPDILSQTDGMRFITIPANEDISSLSAILMDDDYYTFTIEQSEKSGILHRASDVALICLKAKAWLDLSQRKSDGENIDSKQIKKHKNDIFRLAAVLPGNKITELPDTIRNDMEIFIDRMAANPPDVHSILKVMGIGGIDAKDLIGQLRQTFALQEV